MNGRDVPSESQASTLSVDDLDPAEGPQMVALGNRAAHELVARYAGDADGRSGWRAALQWAATLSEDHPDLLSIADDVYAAERRLVGRPGAVALYAAERLLTLDAAPARCFLLGMLEAADRRDTE